MEIDTSIDSWDGIVDNYLKADDLDTPKGIFIVDDVLLKNKQSFDGEARNFIELTTKIGNTKYKFPLNWTNTKFVKEKVKAPKDLIGKVIHWEKVRVHNPSTQKMQDGILLTDVK